MWNDLLKLAKQGYGVMVYDPEPKAVLSADGVSDIIQPQHIYQLGDAMAWLGVSLFEQLMSIDFGVVNARDNNFIFNADEYFKHVAIRRLVGAIQARQKIAVAA